VPTKRGFFIPLGISLITMGVGVGIDAVAAHATSTVAAVAHHGSQVVHDVTLRGVEEGINPQVHEVIDLVTALGTQPATSVAAPDSYFLIVGSPFLPADEFVGVAMGGSLALSAEKKLVSFSSDKIAFLVLELGHRRSHTFTHQMVASEPNGLHHPCFAIIAGQPYIQTKMFTIVISHSRLQTNLAQIAAAVDLNRIVC